VKVEGCRWILSRHFWTDSGGWHENRGTGGLLAETWKRDLPDPNWQCKLCDQRSQFYKLSTTYNDNYSTMINRQFQVNFTMLFQMH